MRGCRTEFLFCGKSSVLCCDAKLLHRIPDHASRRAETHVEGHKTMSESGDGLISGTQVEEDQLVHVYGCPECSSQLCRCAVHFTMQCKFNQRLPAAKQILERRIVGNCRSLRCGSQVARVQRVMQTGCCECGACSRKEKTHATGLDRERNASRTIVCFLAAKHSTIRIVKRCHTLLQMMYCST